MSGSAQSQIVQYLQGRGINPTNANIASVIPALNTNPDLIPGLRASEPVVSQGDQGFVGPPTAPAAPRAQSPRVSAPTSPKPQFAPPSITPDVSDRAALSEPPNAAQLAQNIVNNQPPTAPRVAPTASTGDDAERDRRRAGRPPQLRPPAAQPQTQTPVQTPAPLVGEEDAMDVPNPRPARMSVTPNTSPQPLTETQHLDMTDRAGAQRRPVELPATLGMRVGGSPFIRSALDLAEAIYQNRAPTKPLADMTLHEHAQAAIGAGLGFAGGGLGARAATPALRAPPAARGPTVPNIKGVERPPFERKQAPPGKSTLPETNPWGRERPEPQSQAQPQPTQAAPGQGATAEAASPTTSTASAPVRMPPSVQATGDTVPLSQITGSGQDILYTGQPTHVQPTQPMPPNAVAPAVNVAPPAPTPPQFVSARTGPTRVQATQQQPIEGVVTSGTTNPYNIPGTDVPITPGVVPKPMPTSVPPAVNVAELTMPQMPTPAAASPIPVQTSVPPNVNVGGPRVVPIDAGPPMAQAVARRAAGPRKEPTRATVPPEMTLREAMIERLLGKGRGR